MKTFKRSISIAALAILLASGAWVAAAAGPPVTLKRPATPSSAPDTDGFLRRWIVLEPIPANGLTDSAVQAAVHKEFFPNQFSVIPQDGEKVSVNGAELTWHALDTNRYNFD